jgi:hypothetical protein
LALAAIAKTLLALAAMLTGDTLQFADHAWRIVPAGLAVRPVEATGHTGFRRPRRRMRSLRATSDI